MIVDMNELRGGGEAVGSVGVNRLLRKQGSIPSISTFHRGFVVIQPLTSLS